MSASSSSDQPPPPNLRFVDIGINLTDPVYTGVYHGKKAHDDDLADVVARAKAVGCTKMLVTASDLESAKRASEVAGMFPGTCYTTIGIHPCSTSQIPHPASAHLTALLHLAQTLLSTPSPPLLAFGELGLDYDRLHLSPRPTQLQYFTAQLDIAAQVGLPLFLHSRAAHADFVGALAGVLDRLPRRGVVHSFTGTREEMLELVGMGFDVGVNGCSMKTPENAAVVRDIPLERIQLETDGPWCEIRPSHASKAYLSSPHPAPPALPKSLRKEKWARGCMVKGRNEPCAITHVAYAVAGIKGIPVEEVCEAAWRNSIRMFGFGETVPAPHQPPEASGGEGS